MRTFLWTPVVTYLKTSMIGQCIWKLLSFLAYGSSWRGTPFTISAPRFSQNSHFSNIKYQGISGQKGGFCPSVAKLTNEIWCNNDVPNSIIRFSCLCVVLHPHQEPQKEASALLIHHQIGNFLIVASKFAFIGFSLPPLRAVRGEKKQASNCLTRPPIEPYWLDKAQLNSLQGNPTIRLQTSWQLCTKRMIFA